MSNSTTAHSDIQFVGFGLTKALGMNAVYGQTTYRVNGEEARIGTQIHVDLDRNRVELEAVGADHRRDERFMEKHGIDKFELEDAIKESVERVVRDELGI